MTQLPSSPDVHIHHSPHPSGPPPSTPQGTYLSQFGAHMSGLVFLVLGLELLALIVKIARLCQRGFCLMLEERVMQHLRSTTGTHESNKLARA